MPTWSPNPYAIAQRLEGKGIDIRDAGQQAELVERVFKTKASLLYDQVGDKPAMLALFQDLADHYRAATTVESIWNDPLIKEARGRYGDDPVRRTLPFLIPLADAVFGAPGAAHTDAPFLGDYRPIGAFLVGGASYLDPIQGGVADCYLIASLISLAWMQPQGWRNLLENSGIAGAGATKFRFKFFEPGPPPAAAGEPGGGQGNEVDAPGDAPFDEAGQPCFAHASDPQEGWPAIIEKAYVMHRCGEASGEPTPADYLSIGSQREFPKIACWALIGGTANDAFNSEVPGMHWQDLPGRFSGEITRNPTMAWTWGVPPQHPSWLPPSQTGLAPNHCYALLGNATLNGKNYVILRNPWGVVGLGGPPPPEYATGTWSPAGAGAGPVQLNQRGVFGLPMEWFDACFEGIGWVKP